MISHPTSKKVGTIEMKIRSVKDAVRLLPTYHIVAARGGMRHHPDGVVLSAPPGRLGQSPGKHKRQDPAGYGGTPMCRAAP